MTVPALLDLHGWRVSNLPFLFNWEEPNEIKRTFKKSHPLRNLFSCFPFSAPDLLWKAPELLRDPSAPIGGTPKADIYAFGIILYEIFTRQDAFASYKLEPKGNRISVGPLNCQVHHVLFRSAMVEKIKNGPAPGEQPFRPDLQVSHARFFTLLTIR